MSKIKITEDGKPKLATVSGTKAKETIYVDVDDEITSIIEKLSTSKGDIVALVLPKRAAVLQSIVNMKLLKRAADQANKNLVLVTGENSLLPLAGMVGLHVASTPTSKPTIPPAPDKPSDEPESVDEPLQVEDDTEEVEPEEAKQPFSKKAAAATPIGVLAGDKPKLNEPESIELPDESEVDVEKPDFVPVKRNKKLAVPNFDSFRNKILLAIGGFIGLIVLWFVAFHILPKAKIVIASETTTIKSSLNVTLDTNAKALDEGNKIIPATSQATTKTGTQQGLATGQQNNGEKASGSVTFSLKNCDTDSVTIPAGGSATANGMTYIVQSTVTLNSVFVAGKCNPVAFKNIWSGTTNVVALKAGSNYNASSASFVASGVSGTGSASGGTDSIVKVVSQSDIDGAKARIAAVNTEQIKQELQTALKAKGLLPVPTTFNASEPQVSSTANAGDKADSFTVTVSTPYTMLGVKKDDLKTLIVANVKKQIDTDKQKILKDGVDQLQFSQEATASATNAAVLVRADSVAGPFIDVNEVKQRSKGKKEAAIRGDLQDIPGITDVEVHYSPFWVSTAPTDTKKITVVLDKVNN